MPFQSATMVLPCSSQSIFTNGSSMNGMEPPPCGLLDLRRPQGRIVDELAAPRVVGGEGGVGGDVLEVEPGGAAQAVAPAGDGEGGGRVVPHHGAGGAGAQLVGVALVAHHVGGVEDDVVEEDVGGVGD